MDEEELESMMTSLPKEKGWLLENIYKYKGFWFEKPMLKGSLIVQKNFNPTPETRVLLSTFPKSGTTWFCALLFTIMNRTQYNNNYTTHPLLTQNPHDCAPQIEYKALKNNNNNSLNSIPPLIATHIPYSLLPDSIKQHPNAPCKIVYVCRDPLDNFVSLFHYANKVRPQELPHLSVDEAFNMFCDGVSSYGSYWDHVVEYWNASLQMPHKVCFVRFEDMMMKPCFVLKKVAEFIGCPFSSEEEENGVIQNIVEFCSFDSLTSFKVNSNPEVRRTIPGVNNGNDAFFRKGQIGDHQNYLTPQMIHRLTDIINAKLAGLGLQVFA